jgi:FkbH-like protein
MSQDGLDFDLIKTAIKEGRGQEAFDLLRRDLEPAAPFVVQARAARVLRSLETEAKLQPIKIAIVGSSTLDHFADILKLWLALGGFEADIYIAPFDMMVQTLLDANSEFYSFKPDVVWLFTTYRDVMLDMPPGSNLAAVQGRVGAAVREKAGLWKIIQERLRCIIIQNNADIPAHDPFSNIAGGAVWGSRSALRLYNVELSAAVIPGVVIYDLDHVSALYGKSRWVDSRYWYHSKHAAALDAVGSIAALGARLIAAAKGQAKKCLVLDLDNTLWGGVIGDDGLDGIVLGANADGEAFMAFQSWARALKERGIVLAISSKNDEANAKEPFEKHPDMRLSLSDIAVFRANWNNKAENISDIARILNIGLDSLVFVDDNPAERAIVRKFLPMVEVPELHIDPANYIQCIAERGYFETIGFSDEDRERARYYSENAQRAELELSFADTAGYLQSLQMIGEVGTLDSFHLPRMAQLINKSNQFHLTTTRYSEANLTDFAARSDHVVRYFKLRDRFGDNGLIAVIILKVVGEDILIDTWAMSCRVLARSMEEFITNEILAVARTKGCTRILGTYKPTAKNKLVSGLYQRLGFALVSDQEGTTIWRYNVGPDSPGWVTYVGATEAAHA